VSGALEADSVQVSGDIDISGGIDISGTYKINGEPLAFSDLSLTFGDGLSIRDETAVVNVGDGIKIDSDKLTLKLKTGSSLIADANGLMVNVGDGIKIDSDKLAIKLGSDSGLILDPTGLILDIDSLQLAKPSIWHKLTLSDGWSSVKDFYKCEYRYVQYGSERQYFLRGQIKKSSGPGDWDIICHMSGNNHIRLPPQNMYFIVSVGDIDVTPLNFNQWTFLVNGSHNGIAADRHFLKSAPHREADDSEILEKDNAFSLDQISWWVNTDTYPSELPLVYD